MYNLSHTPRRTARAALSPSSPPGRFLGIAGECVEWMDRENSEWSMRKCTAVWRSEKEHYGREGCVCHLLLYSKYTAIYFVLAVSTHTHLHLSPSSSLYPPPRADVHPDVRFVPRHGSHRHGPGDACGHPRRRGIVGLALLRELVLVLPRKEEERVEIRREEGVGEPWARGVSEEWARSENG